MHGKQMSRHIHLQSLFCNYNGITPITQKDQKVVSDLLRRSFMRLGGLSTSRYFLLPGPLQLRYHIREGWAAFGHTIGLRCRQKSDLSSFRSSRGCRFHRIRYGLLGRFILALVLSLSSYSVSWGKVIIIRQNTALELGEVVHSRGLGLSLLCEVSLLKMHALV